MKGTYMSTPQTDDRKRHLLEAVSNIRNGFVYPDWWKQILRNGLDAFETLPIPNAKTENWRETNVSPFFNPEKKWQLNIQKHIHKENIPETVVKHFTPSIVWENGAISVNLDSSSPIFASHFRDTLQSVHHEIIQRILQEHEPQHIFESLSDMLLYNGIFIYIPRGTVIEEPIHISIISRSENEDTLDVPYLLVYAEENSQCSITAHYSTKTPEQKHLWVNANERFIIGKNSHLKFMNTLQGTSQTLRFLSTSAQLNEDSSLSYNSLHLSGQFIRSEIDVEIQGENVLSQINGLTINEKKHFSETQQLIQHFKGHGTSRIHWRGLGKEESKTVYRGKIYIAPDAQKSDSIQQFKGLSLSDKAIIDAKPQLEIYADDVRCTHGATVGPPPPDLVYYFQTRGIPSIKAKQLLIRGFINQVLKEFPFAQLESFINECADI